MNTLDGPRGVHQERKELEGVCRNLLQKWLQRGRNVNKSSSVGHATISPDFQKGFSRDPKPLVHPTHFSVVPARPAEGKAPGNGEHGGKK